jgi:membrane-bound serine protease (ClpP class)
MNRRIGTFLFLVLMTFAFSLHGKGSDGGVLEVKLEGVIHPIAEEYVSRAIDQAEAQHASMVLIDMQTPGGLMDSMRGIIERILASKVPVVVYVGPSGARAASAGFFILESADVAAMAPGTNTGAAHPVLSSGGNIEKDMRTKVENDAAAFMRAYVSKRGRNVELAETAVRDSKAWSSDEALKERLIDVVASDRQDLFKQLNGREITRFDGSKVRLHFDNPQVTEFPMSLKQELLSWLMDPNIAFVVLAIGGLALYVEFNHPGAVIPGVIGVIFIVLAAFALNLLPVRFAAVTLIFLAFAMFALEAKYATHGVIGIGGMVAMTIGGLLLVDGPIPEMRVRLWTSLSVSVPLGLITIFLMAMALKARRNKVVTGVQGLIGAIGVARTELAPAGKVFIHGELWDARAAGDIREGDPVRVRAVQGFELEVESTDIAKK